MTDARIVTRALDGSPLSRDAIEGRAPAAWYATRPTSPSEWKSHAVSVRDAFSTPDWADELIQAILPGGAAAARLAASAGGRGVVVTTGQQPGLFGGPVFTWSKAISALALADALQAATGIPAAPVFWAATDDSDLAEASVTHVAVPGGVETLAMDAKPSGTAMRDTPLGDVTHLYERLELGAGSAAYRAALDVVRECYTPDATVGSAYVALLRRVLEPLGICVLDAGHSAVRNAAQPLLMRGLDRAGALEEALIQRETEIRSAGFQPQVAAVDGLSLVFSHSGGVRRRIPVSSAASTVDSSVDAQILSPNVLFRPVVERAILPTVAYVAGPGEIAYFAQVSAVAAALDAPLPLAVPRWSGTIVPSQVDRVLERYGIGLDDLRVPNAVETRLLRSLIPASVRASLERFRERVDESSRDLAGAVSEVKPPLVPETVITGARRALMHKLDRVERHAAAATARREAQLLYDIATARGAIYPFGKPQERVLNFIPLLARYGTGLMQQMLGCALEHAVGLGLKTS